MAMPTMIQHCDKKALLGTSSSSTETTKSITANNNNNDDDTPQQSKVKKVMLSSIFTQIYRELVSRGKWDGKHN